MHHPLLMDVCQGMQQLESYPKLQFTAKSVCLHTVKILEGSRLMRCWQLTFSIRLRKGLVLSL